MQFVSERCGCKSVWFEFGLIVAIGKTVVSKTKVGGSNPSGPAMQYLDFKIIKKDFDNIVIKITKQKYFYKDFDWTPIGLANLSYFFYSTNGIKLISLPLSKIITPEDNPKSLEAGTHIVFFHNTTLALYVFGSSYEYKMFKETIIQIPNEYWPKVKIAIIEYNLIMATKEKVIFQKNP